jgi:predicted transcriptional regulator
VEIQFTSRELDVMSVLWECGPSTVAEVRNALPDSLAYTTVLTVLRVLEDKGHATHTTEGRAHRYVPLVDREVAGESALRRVTERLFSGSAELLLTHLVEAEEIPADELRRMQELLARRLEGDER